MELLNKVATIVFPHKVIYFFCKVWLQPLLKVAVSKNDYITKEDVVKIFSTASDISKYHYAAIVTLTWRNNSKLLKLLQKRAVNWNSSRRFGNIFVDQVLSLKTWKIFESLEFEFK